MARKADSDFAAKGTYEAGGMRFYVPNGDGTHRAHVRAHRHQADRSCVVKIELTPLTVRDVAENYRDNDEGGGCRLRRQAEHPPEVPA